MEGKQSKGREGKDKKEKERKGREEKGSKGMETKGKTSKGSCFSHILSKCSPAGQQTPTFWSPFVTALHPTKSTHQKKAEILSGVHYGYTLHSIQRKIYSPCPPISIFKQ